MVLSAFAVPSVFFCCLPTGAISISFCSVSVSGNDGDGNVDDGNELDEDDGDVDVDVDDSCLLSCFVSNFDDDMGDIGKRVNSLAVMSSSNIGDAAL